MQFSERLEEKKKCKFGDGPLKLLIEAFNCCQTRPVYSEVIGLKYLDEASFIIHVDLPVMKRSGTAYEGFSRTIDTVRSPRVESQLDTTIFTDTHSHSEVPHKDSLSESNSIKKLILPRKVSLRRLKSVKLEYVTTSTATVKNLLLKQGLS